MTSLSLVSEVRISDESLTVQIALIEHEGFRLTYAGPLGGEPRTAPSRTPRMPASPDLPAGLALMAQRGTGYGGAGLIDAVNLTTGQTVNPRPTGLRKAAPDKLLLEACDEISGLKAEVAISVEAGAIRCRTRLVNEGSNRLAIGRCASLLWPLPDWASSVRVNYGSWAREGFEAAHELDAGAFERISRLGRTGFDGPPAFTLTDHGTQRAAGRAIRVGLEWSGSHCLRAERFPNGAGECCAEVLFEPGEMVLEPGGIFDAPAAFVLWSEEGLDGITALSHRRARALNRPAERHKESVAVARPVHFNTWEARYFDFDEESLKALALDAAALGAERFVLDDGWFKGRRNDHTSLGDWVPDPERFPEGLAPLIAHVHTLGMRFGLWVEPEMVSRESTLYRNHPEWVLGYPDPDAPTGRQQLVLDLSNEKVRDYLFDSLSALLSPGGIDYLKWDCNRELYPAGIMGKQRAHAQVEGLYALWQRLRDAFPHVEIESCASGGGRMDFGVLPFVSRFWASDATDALDRIRINRAAMSHLPQEMIGAHVGSSPNHITGRTFSMAFRALVALFGHLGLELDPAQLTAEERQTLIHAIGIFKRFRGLIHEGRIRWQDERDPALDVTLIGKDDELLLRILRTDTAPRPLNPRIALQSLDRDALYSISEIALETGDEHELGSFSGAALAWTGLSADPRQPNRGRLFHLRKTQKAKTGDTKISESIR